MKIILITGIIIVVLCIGAYKLINKIFEEINKME